MVDEMPPEWEAFYEKDRALLLSDLRKAKDVIRKVRERRFVPEEHAAASMSRKKSVTASQALGGSS